MFRKLIKMSVFSLLFLINSSVSAMEQFNPQKGIKRLEEENNGTKNIITIINTDDNQTLSIPASIAEDHIKTLHDLYEDFQEPSRIELENKNYQSLENVWSYLKILETYDPLIDSLTKKELADYIKMLLQEKSLTTQLIAFRDFDYWHVDGTSKLCQNLIIDTVLKQTENSELTDPKKFKECIDSLHNQSLFPLLKNVLSIKCLPIRCETTIVDKNIIHLGYDLNNKEFIYSNYNAFSSDCLHRAKIASDDNTALCIIDKNGSIMRIARSNVPARITKTIISPNNQLMCLGTCSGSLVLINTSDLNSKGCEYWDSSSSPISSLTFSHNSKFLLSTQGTVLKVHRIRIKKNSKFENVRTIDFNSKPFATIFAPTNKFYGVLFSDGIEFFHLNNDTKHIRWKLPAQICNAAFNPDGSILAICLCNGQIILFPSYNLYEHLINNKNKTISSLATSSVGTEEDFSHLVYNPFNVDFATLGKSPKRDEFKNLRIFSFPNEKFNLSLESLLFLHLARQKYPHLTTRLSIDCEPLRSLYKQLSVESQKQLIENKVVYRSSLGLLKRFISN